MVHKLSCPGLLLKNIKGKYKIFVSAKARKVAQINLARTASIAKKLSKKYKHTPAKRFSIFDQFETLFSQLRKTKFKI